jgi:glycosyltransferase involved in cell wall biosynthesis
MRIAQVSPLFERVPPEQYGGTERIVSYLTEELVRRGHQVTLFASGDSRTRARLVAGTPRSLRTWDEAGDPVAHHFAMLAQAYERAADFDLVHVHCDYVALPFARSAPVPTIVTLHGRLDIPELAPVFRAFPQIGLVSISDAQRTPLDGVRWVATVHHGLPRDLYTASEAPGRHLVFLGRISTEKCPDAAIRAAIRAGVPLKIAAKVDRPDRAYFEQVVRPLLDHPLVEFLGEVSDERKQSLLAGARALLFPIDWPEPFGIAVIEALACGTPVIARRRGSVPEIVAHGRTGFICDTEDDMVAAIGRLGTLSRVACRAAFEEHFAVERMAADYLAAYEREIAAWPLPRVRPPRAGIAERGATALRSPRIVIGTPGTMREPAATAKP